MEDHTLIELLHAADESVALPAIETELPDRVRRLCVRRRRIRTLRAAGGLATFVIVAGVLMWLPEAAPRRVADSGREVAGAGSGKAAVDEDLASLARLRSEAEYRMSVVAELRAVEAAARRRYRNRASVAASDAIAAELDRTGRILLRHADRLAANPSTQEQAWTQYENITRVLPDSLWATFASGRLAQRPG